MRFTTVLSFLIALVLAGAAVFGAQQWLALERQQISAAMAQQQEKAEEEPKETIVVAGEQLAFGEMLVKTKVREIEWSGSIRPEGSFSTIDELIVGEAEDTARFATTTITPGEPILATKITVPGVRAKMSTMIAPGKVAMAIPVNAVTGAAGFVLPGDRVNILLTRRDNGGFTDVLLQGIKVVAVDQDANEGKDQPSVVRTVTFEVAPEEAMKLTLAQNVGTLTLTLRNFASNEVREFPRITLGDLSEQDAADDLLEQAAEAAAEAPDANEERFSALEALLKNMNEGISARMEGMEQKINEQEPVIIEKEVEVIVEKEVKPKLILPQNATVGVIRNGRRDEYKVKIGEELTDEEEDSQDVSGQNVGSASFVGANSPNAVIPTSGEPVSVGSE